VLHLAGFAVIFLVSCQTMPPKLTPCSIINTDLAECTDPDTEEYFDKPIKKMLLWTCYSPEDLGEVKKYLRKVFESFEDYYQARVIGQRGHQVGGRDGDGREQPRRTCENVPVDHWQGGG